MTKVVNIYKEKCEVYIGRAGRGHDGYFGNPIRFNPSMAREEVIDLYKRYFFKRITDDAEFKQRILGLKGKTLGCFCAPKLCHGDVIVEFLEDI